jgi:Monooxygenase af470-like
MADIRKGRWTAEIEGDFVVFLIGVRINRPLSVLRSMRDLGGRRGMRHMLDHLTEHPEKGLLGY